MKGIATFLCLLLCSLLFPQQKGATPATGTVRAVFVGISDYQARPPLRLKF